MSTATPQLDNRGDWRELSRHRARYAVVADMLRGSDSVLDLGCGEGLLRQWLGECDYTGVDLSYAAIEAAPRGTGKFVCDDLMKWRPDRKYSAIVFNESLYYLSDPLAALKRYSEALTDDGLIIVSVWRPLKMFRPHGRVFRLACNFLSDGYTVTVSEDGLTWDVLKGRR